MKYYGVRKGKEIGVYETWQECEAQVKGYKGAEYKKFDNEKTARNYVYGNDDTIGTRQLDLTDEVLKRVKENLSNIIKYTKDDNKLKVLENVKDIEVLLGIKLDETINFLDFI